MPKMSFHKGNKCVSRVYKKHFRFSFCRKFAQTIPRGFGVRYNPYTQSIDILDSPRQMTDLLKQIRTEMDLLLSTMEKL